MATRRDLKVALRVEGKTEIHAVDTNGNYATLCGVDGDDDLLEQESIDLPKRAAITCETCYSIYRLARELRASDFSIKLRRRARG